jgi:hypothetical protein
MQSAAMRRSVGTSPDDAEQAPAADTTDKKRD